MTDTMDAVIATWAGDNMFRARAQARRYAELARYHEQAGADAVAGVWATWYAFVDQWPESSLEHRALAGVFAMRLDELDTGDRHDFPDTW